MKSFTEIQLKVDLFTYDFIVTNKYRDSLHPAGRTLTSDLSTISSVMVIY